MRLGATDFGLRAFWSGAASRFRERVGGAEGRPAKIMIGALARKLLIALWRFAKDGLIQEGGDEGIKRLSSLLRFWPETAGRRRFPRALKEAPFH